LQLLNFIIPQSCNLSIFQSCNLIFFQSYNLSSINNTLLLRQTRTQINRLINVVFFTFLFSLFSFSYGQVKIKEKVEIKPGSGFLVIKNLSKNSTATIEVIANWTRKCGPEPVTAKVDLWKEGSNDVLATSSSTGTPVTVSVTVSEEGNYLANIDFTNPLGHYNCADITWQFLVDGKQEGENETCNSCGSSSISRYVKFSECGEDAPECDGEQEIPQLEPVVYELENECTEAEKDGDRVWGISEIYPMDNNSFYDNQEINICINNGIWQFKLGDENKLIPKYRTGICIENMRRDLDHLIFDISSVDDIEENEICKALHDFKIFKNPLYYGNYYGQIDYIIVEAVAKHEIVHTEDYKNILQEAFNLYKNMYLDLSLSCENGDDYQDALTEFTNLDLKIKNNIRKNFKRLFMKYKERIRIVVDNYRYSYEENTQADLFVQETIDTYIQRLENRAIQLNLNCN